jgi:insulysin
MKSRLGPCLRFFFSLTLLACFRSAAGAAEAAPVPVPALPPRVKAPTDTAEFRHLVLENGLRVLLVSDAKFNKSGAALAVSVGQIDDPADREGMAHFLEHMVFLGTEKYPDVSSYDNFIGTNGGYSNAYTASDHTNYQFEVRHEALVEALDRFAQFFIAPRFSPEFTAREIFAVHNEAMRHMQNDIRRMMNVSRELYAPGSGESKFSAGNKDTLQGATPEQVRAFYEAHYSSDRMALALAGKLSLDELEKLAREKFAAVPRRNLPTVERVPAFLPRASKLRLAQIEPVKEQRLLTLEFVVPSTRAQFAARSDLLLSQLLSYPGEGGLVARLKRDGLANSVSGDIWDRTPAYGSLFIQISLTPEGQAAYPQVLASVFAYLQHLRSAPFPQDFFQDRARIAALNETYRDRGEGAELATRLANQALFFPLEVADRAGDVWGAPDEASYRQLLAALVPENLLVSLMAKGLKTDREERIYGTAYSYREDEGPTFASLTSPPTVAGFALPSANRFLPGETRLLAERPMQLVNENGLSLFYAPDTEFQRPQTSLIYRFVPTRAVGSADSAALLRLFDACLRDHLEAAGGEADLAGLDFSLESSLEGFKLSVTGFGDSPLRFAEYIAGQIRTFQPTPERFAALKEVTLRGLRSYAQTEAYMLGRDRRDALSREIYFLPSDELARAESAAWSEVQTFSSTYFGRGKLEAVLHGHVAPDAAVTAARAFAAKLGSAAAEPAELLRRRHVAISVGETVLDVAPTPGVNSAYLSDYLLPPDSPTVRASALVMSNFMADLFYSELRTKRQLGYIVGSGAGGSGRQRYLSFTVQSSGYAADDLRRRAETFIATLPAQLQAATDEQWATLIAGVRATMEEKPKGLREKAEQFFSQAFVQGEDWERRRESLAALDQLTRDDVVALLARSLDPATARRRTILLTTTEHPPTEALTPTFTDRAGWKRQRAIED